jgi:hypothetical protein
MRVFSKVPGVAVPLSVEDTNRLDLIPATSHRGEGDEESSIW